MRRTANVRVWGLAVMAAMAGLCPCGRTMGAAEQEDAGPWQEIHRNTADSFVLVRYHLKKSDRPHMNGAAGSGYSSRNVLQYILNRNTLDALGVILSDRGEVFTFDKDPLYREVIERITVTGVDGVERPAQADRLLVRTSGRILRIEGGLPAGWKPMQFDAIGDVTPDTRLFTATIKPDNRYHVYVKACGYGFGWGSAEGGGPCLEVPEVFCASVLCNAAGRPVGLTCLDRIDLGVGGPTWRGRDILADPGLPEQRQLQLQQWIETEFAKNLYEIRITPRPEPGEEDEYDLGGRYAFMRRLSQEQGGEREAVTYGLAFSDDKLLIPETLTRELAAGIDTITVAVGDKDLPGRFAGVLARCGATVIELAEGTLPHFTAFPADGRLARVEPFWAVRAEELAGMDLRIEFTRWIDKQQGYADLWYPVLERPVPSGSWLLDGQGRLAGFMGEARHEHDRLAPYLVGVDRDRYRAYGPSYPAAGRRSVMPGLRYAYASDTQLFDGAEMARMLADPAGYDPRIRHLSEDEQKRRVWLGVEYTAPNKEMVKQLGLRQQTRDGRIGLVVNRVYVGSPAARLGLVEGDVLLRMAVADAPWPIELTAGERGRLDMPDLGEEDLPREFAAMGMQMPRRRPWPSRENYLTRMLADIGVGTSVKLAYVHDGQLQEKDFVIEQAPRDMLSAGRYKDDALGLTVKDVTYEVRAALRLEEADAAVVITRVEDGTPAGLARLNIYELIRAVDGETVDSVETFERLIAAARQQGKTSVRLTVEWMGKTRLADLKFDAEASPGLLRSIFRGE